MKNTRMKIVFLAFSVAYHGYGIDMDVCPNDSIFYLEKTPASTNVWWVADDSMQKVNEGITAKRRDAPKYMIDVMGWGLLHEPFQLLAWDEEDNRKRVPKIMEALYRGGDDSRITNILHMALLAPTNYFREATFRAYVMASPVPMTFLAETMAERIPASARAKWYGRAAEEMWHPSLWRALSPWSEKPSRESLRLAHYLYIAKSIETDPACLKAIGKPVDPKRNKAKGQGNGK